MVASLTKYNVNENISCVFPIGRILEPIISKSDEALDLLPKTKFLISDKNEIVGR